MMNINAIGHIILASVSVIGIIVLQSLGKGQPELYALLGGIAGFSGQTASMHSIFESNSENEEKKS